MRIKRELFDEWFIEMSDYGDRISISIDSDKYQDDIMYTVIIKTVGKDRLDSTDIYNELQLEVMRRIVLRGIFCKDIDSAKKIYKAFFYHPDIIYGDIKEVIEEMLTEIKSHIIENKKSDCAHGHTEDKEEEK